MVVTLEVALDARRALVAAQQMRRGINRVADAVERMDARQQRNTRTTQRHTQQVNLLGSAYLRLGRLARGFLAFLSARQLIRGINTMQQLESRLRGVAGNQSEVNTRFRQLEAIARSTFTPLESTVTLYTRLQRTISELGREENALRITENLNNIIRDSGVSAQAASAAMTQLAQAIQSGRLQGDEFRSISENLPQILTVLNRSLGTTTAQLREMSRQGKLTTDIVLPALEDTLEGTSDASGEAQTLSQAWTNLETASLSLARAISEGGLGRALIKVIGWLEEIVTQVGNVIRAFDVLFLIGTEPSGTPEERQLRNQARRERERVRREREREREIVVTAPDVRKLEDFFANLQERQLATQVTPEVREQFRAGRQARRLALEVDDTLTEEQLRGIERYTFNIVQQTQALEENARKQAEAQARAEALGADLASALTDPLRELILTGEIDDLMETIGERILNALLENLILKPAELAIQTGIGALLGGIFNQGAALQSGRVVPFQKGGVIENPSAFGMNAGRVGLISESRPEAAFPLTRTRDGDLAVQAVGAGGGTPVSITQNFYVRSDDHMRRTLRQVNEENRRQNGTSA